MKYNCYYCDIELLDGSEYFINADDEKVYLCGTCDEVEPTDEEYAVSHCCYKKGLKAEIERLKKEKAEIERQKKELEEFCYEPSPPIKEDTFKFNSKCVCEKKEDNDYPCLCDDFGPTDDEK